MEKRKKSSRFRVLAIVVICVIIAECVTIAVIRHNVPSASAVEIGESKKEVTVNEKTIPSYNIKGDTYISLDDLGSFGVKYEKNADGNIEMTYKTSDAKDTVGIFAKVAAGTKVTKMEKPVLYKDKKIECYTNKKYIFMPSKRLEVIGESKIGEDSEKYALFKQDSSGNIIAGSDAAKEHVASANGNVPESAAATAAPANDKSASQSGGTAPSSSGGKVIVLDPGHGKSSSEMSESEKKEYGWTYNEKRGQWGEWRHWKTGTVWQDCEGTGCNGRAPENAGCWYPIGNGDRDTEPDINLQNSLAAKKYLEQMGYTVRMTRTSNNENPSITRRIRYCYPNNDTSAAPDAALFLCIHSNSGGGRGTAYIELAGPYDQKGISSTYAEDGNTLGKTINDCIVANTEMPKYSGGVIGGEPQLIAFCKCPVTCGYMEIGFFDSSSDLSILKNSSDSIGRSIAQGIDKYIKSK